MHNQRNSNSSIYPLDVKAAHAINKIAAIGCETEWDLTPDQSAILLGINKHQYLSLLCSAQGIGTIQVDPDLYERASMLLGIYKGLSFIEPEQSGVNFFNRPCTAFNDHSIKDNLLHDPSLDNMQRIRGYLNAKRC